MPNDDRFHVLLDATVVFSSASKTRSLAEYRRLKDQLMKERGQSAQLPQVDPREILRRELAYYQTEAVLADSYGRRRRKAMRKGGKAGRQGYK